jgi:Na+/proline symporter
MAFLCLPRQFHVAVVEHGHPSSLKTARWLFPAYLVLINLLVIPIAATGLLLLGPKASPDLFVLQLPLAHGEGWLSAFVFIGGLSAATAMVIVACMALSGMIGNELVMPYLLRRQAGVAREMGPLVVFVRRAAVVLILMAGYAYERIISGYLPLASIGLISFCAVANWRRVSCSASTGAARIATASWRDWPAASSSGSTRSCCRPCTRIPVPRRWRR